MDGPARSLWRHHRAGMPFFAVAPGSGRERSGSDVVRLVVATLAGLVLSAVAEPPSGFEKALISLIDEIPSFFDLAWRFGAASIAAWALVVLVAAAVRRRGEVLVDAVGTALVSVALAVLLGHRLTGSWPAASEVLGDHGGSSAPVVALSLVAGAALAAAPHLSGPFRRLGGWCIAAAAVSVALLGSGTPTGVALSLVLAAMASAAVHLVLGSAAGRPTLGEVAAALDDLDVEAVELSVASRGADGVLVVDGTDRGSPVRIRVYGRDARDSRFLSRLWRSLWYRDAAPATWTRQQQVEHEGFVTLLAAGRGVPVAEVVTAGSTGSRDAVLVTRGGGVPLTGLGPDDLDDDRVGEVWDALASLHEADMAHGAIDPSTFVLLDGRVVVSDLASVVIAPSDDLRRIDRAQVLVVTALLVGIERAVVVAADRLGDDGIGEMLPYLQLPAMPRTLRHALRSAPFDLDALASATAGVVDIERPDLRQLRRVSPRTLITAALIALVAFALITALGQIDPAEVAEILGSADPVWLVVALLVAQLPFFSQAVATRGACPRPLPYGPVVMLQVGIGFIALAVPTTAGRLALDIRFFQRQGVPPASAVSISAIDGFTGFLVQSAVLVLTLVLGVGSVDLSVDRQTGADTSDLAVVLAVAAGVLALLVLAAVALPTVRRRILARVRPELGQVRDTLQGLRSLSHVLQLLLGNLANQLLFAAALGASLAAFGGRLDLATLTVVYVVAALFGGFMPVPGGIGAVEAALIAGLVAAGIDKGTAAATAMTFRFATFYLPPLWGWIAMRWLERHEYL